MRIIKKISVMVLLLFVLMILLPPAAAGIIDADEKADGTGGGEHYKTSGEKIRKVEIPTKIKVYRQSDKKTVKVDFEDYVACVVASEMPSEFDIEALKAQSVAARTFAVSKLKKYDTKKPLSHPDAPICDTTHCQVYKTEKELIACHPEGWKDEGWKKIRKACSATRGQLLYYEGELVMQPLFFSSSGGQTENSEDVFVSAVPYLISVSSPYEEEATHRDEKLKLSVSDFAAKIRNAFPDRQSGTIDENSIKILSRTAGGRVEYMKAGSLKLKGTEVRSALGLSSSLFTISFDGHGNITITSSGSGHGVGMSQYGADGMAKKGSSYREILRHYYSGTEIY